LITFDFRCRISSCYRIEQQIQIVIIIEGNVPKGSCLPRDRVNFTKVKFEEKKKIWKNISHRQSVDDDRQLIQHLVNEYLLEGSNDVLDLIRNCPNECFEVKINEKLYQKKKQKFTYWIFSRL